MEGRCRDCGRLIFDVKDVSDLPEVLECQHCGHRNRIIACVEHQAVFATRKQLKRHIVLEHKGG